MPIETFSIKQENKSFCAVKAGMPVHATFIFMWIEIWIINLSFTHFWTSFAALQVMILFVDYYHYRVFNQQQKNEYEIMGDLLDFCSETSVNSIVAVILLLVVLI